MRPERPQRLSPEDFALSMRISARARRPEQNAGLRTVIVHRLVDSMKAIWRESLRSGSTAMYCEPCDSWTPTLGDPPVEWTCGRCDRVYGIEFVIYAELDDDDNDPAEAEPEDQEHVA